MTSVARRSGPARQAGAQASPGAYPGARAATASRPDPYRRTPARQAPVPAGTARQAPVPAGSRPARVGERGALTAIIAGAVVVLGLWWHSTPGVHGLGGWLTGAGQVLGLLAGYGVVVLVALMARLPP
ncbi:MAG TPA: hypothetical protein VFQ68_45770, partial [Streptosporangiaceae bacterium]|nr:hypothetical protein [Streptosporangiaceae bacterium]